MQKIKSIRILLSIFYMSRRCHLFLSFSAQGFRDILYAGLAYSSIHGLGELIQFHEPGL